MALKDILFGKAPEARIETKKTVTSEQEAALNKLLQAQTAGIDDPSRNVFTGTTQTTPSSIENLSLAALEERVMQIGQGGSPLEQQTNQALLDIISSGGAPAGQGDFEEFFRTNIEAPLTEQFEDRFTGIGRRFSGTGLFGSERALADRRSKEDFLDALVSSRAGLQFQERTSSADRLLSAIGLGQKGGAAITGELQGIAGLGFDERRLQQQDISKDLEAFALQQGLDVEDLRLLLSGVNVRAVENIALVSGGTTGLLPSLISGAAQIAAAGI